MQARNLTAPQCNQNIRIVSNAGLRLVHKTGGDQQPPLFRYIEVASRTVRLPRDSIGATLRSVRCYALSD